MPVKKKIIKSLLHAHRIEDDDMWGNITCGCGAKFHGGDEMVFITNAQKAHFNHVVDAVTEGVNEALEKNA